MFWCALQKYLKLLQKQQPTVQQPLPVHYWLCLNRVLLAFDGSTPIGI